ncbi:piggyBac transposable element-derived protein 4-like [Homalodisca vitripennis]|uniref:piggyBac transposable element-derived protein 4-like n=1 Tax=Homalodisca vitripennis TaxID=197043 RepID=UPI001EEAB32B|nr:piggyBac transposable element-derived protein 4-like [Homalodisca vitripennis]
MAMCPKLMMGQMVKTETSTGNDDDGNEWDDIKSTVRQFPYTDNEGLVYDFDISNPVTVLEQFLTDDIINLIVEETNRYARQDISNNIPKQRSFMRQWIDCTSGEIKQFLGILIVMGMCPLPQIRFYWSNDTMFKNDFIKQAMKRERFEMLLRCLHFHNNEEAVGEEPRMKKLQNLQVMLNDRFKAVRIPGETVVIDETMVPWRGRLNFRQYLPDKSHKYGVKIYKLCSPDGYTCKFKIYVGKGDITSGKGHKQKIMLHLIHDFLGHGRLLYADNYYNSVELAEALLKRKTYLCGTLRKDLKSNPKTVISKKLKKGEVYAQENKQGVKVISWVDKRRVNLISTRPEDGDNLLPSKKTNRNKRTNHET